MIARKTTLIFVQNIIGTLLGTVALFLVARNMGATPMGIVGFGMAFVGLFSILADLGVDQTHVKRISEGQDPAKCLGFYIVAKFVLVGFMCLSVFAALFIWKYLLGKGFESPEHETVIYIFLAYFIFMNLSKIPQQTFIGRSQIAKQQIPIIVGTIVKSVATIVVALIIRDVMVLALTYVASAIVIFSISTLEFRNVRIARPDRETFRTYYRYALPLLVPISFALIGENLDKVMVQLFWNSKEVGYLYSFQIVTTFLLMIPASLATVLFPSISHHHSKGEMSAIRRIAFKSERYTTMVLAPLVIFIVFFPRQIIHIALSDDFLPGAPVLVLLTINAFLAGIRNLYGNLIYALDKVKIIAKIVPLMFPLRIFLNVVLIPTSIFGITLFGLSVIGAAIATLAMTVINLLVVRIIAYRLTKIKFNWGILKHVAAAVVMALALYLFDSFLNVSRWYDLLLLFGLGAGIYLGLLYASKEFKAKDFHFFMDIINPRKMASYIGSEVKEKERSN